MSSKRISQLENTLRRLRQMAFESDRAARLIPKIKARLMPHWNARYIKHIGDRLTGMGY
jgi:hypothetical protein